MWDSETGVTVRDVLRGLTSRGISLKDPRIHNSVNLLQERPLQEKLSRDDFDFLFQNDVGFLEKVLTNYLVIPEFEDFCDTIREIYESVKNNNSGKTASYIPPLARVSPDLCSISICTIDGQIFNIGDFDEYFCIQSSCKPTNYCLAIEENGIDRIHQHIGHEPSGRSFNELTLNEDGLPHNPLINSGAIMCCSLIRPELSIADRFDHVLNTWKSLCFDSNIQFNNSVYLSERETADRNYALAYFMRENNAFPLNTDLQKTLDFYFQCCSIETNTQNMATMAATFANGGVNPFTKKRIFEPSAIKYCLSLMNTCGMYDYSGEFAFNIGLPAKSGVSGVVFLVIPNTMGICIWSPRLDKNGNSVRAIEFCKELNQRYLFHCYDSLVSNYEGKSNPRLNENVVKSGLSQELCFAAFSGDLPYMKSLVLQGADVNLGDYDQRTPLHLAVCEERMEIVRYLMKQSVYELDVHC